MDQEQSDVDSAQIEAGVKEELNKEQIVKLERLLQAGQELLFGKESHYKMLEGLESSQDVGGDLGKGAIGMLLMLIKQSGDTLTGDIALPAGLILLARLTEFMNMEGSGLPHVSDDDYEEATHIFTIVVQYHFDPEFRAEFDKQQRGQAPEQEPPMAPEQPQPQVPQALLNQGV